MEILPSFQVMKHDVTKYYFVHKIVSSQLQLNISDRIHPGETGKAFHRASRISRM